MKRKLQSVLSCILLFAILLSNLPLAVPAQAIDEPGAAFEPENASPLIVTEVVTTGPTTGRYTYVEIYNNSDSPINFKDYSLYYWYTTSLGYTWTTQETDVIIGSGKCLVLWMNDGTKGTTLENFNTYYGVNLEENVDIYQINFSGIHATAKRGFRVGLDADNIITEAWCNADGADVTTAQANNKLGVQYAYPPNGIVSTKNVVSTATPGAVEAWQVPETRVAYDGDAPEVVSTAGSSDVVAVDQPFTAQATVDGMVGAMNVSLYYKQAEDLEYLKVRMARAPGTKTYTAALDRTLLWGDEVIWYVEASYSTGISGRSVETHTPIDYAPMEDDEKAPLVITEIVTPPGSGQQYSYIEVYNRTNQAINYGFYNIYYQYPVSLTYLTWPPTEPNVMIQPGKTLVLWLSDNGTTVAQFNARYGTALVENEDIVRIAYSGLSRTDPRNIYIGHTFDAPIVTAKINETGADLAANTNKSIQYTYPRTADNASVKVSTDTIANPGAVEAWQVPADPIPFRGYEGYPPDDGSFPSVKLAETLEPINEGEELNVTFDIADTMGLTYMAINYRLDGEGEFKRVYEATQRVKYNFFARVPSDVLFGHAYVEFFVEGYNLFRKTTTETYRVDINQINDINNIRLNVTDNSVLGGSKTITANAGHDNSATRLFIDGEEISTEPVLENGAYLALTLGGVNSYFKNALTASSSAAPQEILAFFSRWSSLDSRIVFVDNKYFSQDAAGNYDITFSMWAGDSGTPFDDIYIPSENRDDYTVTNLQLRLANGKEYLPTEIGPDNVKSNPSTAYDAIHTIGDSAGMSPRLDISFHIPKEEVTAVGYQLDTTALVDGIHHVKAVSGEKEAEIQFVVDNAKPEIDVGIAEDSVVTNQLSINPEITDGSGISKSGATLDGEEISLPYEIAARELAVGEHELVITAVDVAGNIAQKTIHFKIEEVDPNAAANSGGEISATSAKLLVDITKLNADKATVEFLQGKRLTEENGGVKPKSGYGNFPLSDASFDSPSDIPYQLYTIDASGAGENDTITASWTGASNYSDANHPIRMYVLNVAADKWDVIGTADAAGTIDVSFAARDHLQDEKAYVLVQGFATPGTPKTSSAVSSLVTDAPSSAWDGTARPENYDFAFAWMTDTQYYVENWPYHFTQQNEWLVDIADEWDVRYTIHTGDLVDEYELNEQWLVADSAMKILDDAGMPYGVLGGNHDVAAGNQEYGNYWKYFGEQRFADKPWYGGSYNNNLGHYDLLTENGQDMIILYMSWDIYEEEINWMNQVLAQYSDRMAIIALHRYTNVKMTNNTYLDYAGKVLQENVVAKNPNVIAVINGHYHGSAIETTAFDDNGDGIDDRQVYQICTDYQSDVEGGSEYIKFLYFDLQNNKVYMNSYSPYREDFNYFDTPKLDSYAAGTKMNDIDIFELDINFDTEEKTLTTQSFDAQILSDSLIGTVENAVDSAEYIWEGLSPSTTYGWYAKITNEKGGVTLTPVQELSTTGATHQVSASAGAGGSISNPGVTLVADGGNITFTITPHAGYRINQVLLDGEPVSLTDGKLTLSNVVHDHTVSVSFAKESSEPQNSEASQEPVTSATVSSTTNSSGKTTASVTTSVVNALVAAAKKVEADGKPAVVELTIKTTAATKSAVLTVPADAFAGISASTNAAFKVDAGVAVVIFSAAAVDAISSAAGTQAVHIAVSAVDSSSLSAEAQRLSGSRPVYDFSVTAGDRTISSFGNGSAAVSIPYTLQPGEDVNAVIVYYIDDAGMVQTVRGAYNRETKSVNFVTQHFSQYAVGYNAVSFADVNPSAWYYAPVTFSAARGITTGVTATTFSPDTSITRGQFIVMLLRAYGIKPGGSKDDNFADAGNTYYTDYLAKAKDLGISTGIGDNLFAPEKEITREELFTLLYRALDYLGELPKETAKVTLSGFSDAASVSDYAKDAMTALVKGGVIAGSDGKLAPQGQSTRAQMVQVLYNLLHK